MVQVAWPEPEGPPETISLGPMVFPKGLLGNLGGHLEFLLLIFLWSP